MRVGERCVTFDRYGRGRRTPGGRWGFLRGIVRWVILAWCVPIAFAQTPLGGDSPCDSCEPPADWASVRLLTAASVESIGALYARRNLAAMKHAQDAYGLGDGGHPSPRAVEGASLLFQLNAWDGIRLVAELALPHERILVVGDDDAVSPLREDYANVAVYPLRFVERAVLGRGFFCLRYRIPSLYEERIRMGPTRLRTAVEEVRLPKKGTQRIFLREFALSDRDKIEMLFEEFLCGKAHSMRLEDRGDSLELVMLYDLQGIYVRKAAHSKLGALAVWRSIPSSGRLTSEPRLGACAYFPRLTFSLPSFLPDLGLDDLRDFAYPQPVAPKVWFSFPERYLPTWLQSTPAGTFTRWKSLGPRPLIFSELFPDL